MLDHFLSLQQWNISVIVQSMSLNSWIVLTDIFLRQLIWKVCATVSCPSCPKCSCCFNDYLTHRFFIKIKAPVQNQLRKCFFQND